jgi:hypothetical protein
MAVSVTAHGVGTLQIGQVKVEGDQVTIPVLLGGDVGAGVAAMDFRFTYNPEVLQPLTAVAGSAAAQAQKRVLANMGAPGEYVVVMMGMNQTTCNSGEVVNVVLRKTPGAGENLGLGLSRATLSAADGSPIASTTLPYQGLDEEDEDPQVPDEDEEDDSSDDSDSRRPVAPTQPLDPPSAEERAAVAAGGGGRTAEAPASDQISVKDIAEAIAEVRGIRESITTPTEPVTESANGPAAPEGAQAGEPGEGIPETVEAQRVEDTGHNVDAGTQTQVAQAGGQDGSATIEEKERNSATGAAGPAEAGDGSRGGISMQRLLMVVVGVAVLVAGAAWIGRRRKLLK